MEGMLKEWHVEDKTVAFVTDWGSNMLKAGANLSERLPNLIGSVGCTQHLISLVLKDYGKVECINNVFAKARGRAAAAAALAPPAAAAGFKQHRCRLSPCPSRRRVQVKEIVKFITSHTVPNAIYDIKKAELKGTALVKECATRFGYKVLASDSVLRNE